MVNNILDVEPIVQELELHGLKDLFVSLCEQAKINDILFLHPQSLTEKKEIDSLVRMGLLNIDDQEFRISLLGSIKVSNVICSMTELGTKVSTVVSK